MTVQELTPAAPPVPDHVASCVGYTAEFVMVDGTTAEQWLLHNDGNRNPKPQKIEQYLRDMNAGNWMFTGEPIKFDHTGRLIDGQNRLSALAKHARPQMFLVIRGLDPAAQALMDRPAIRTAYDMFTMLKVPNAKTLGAVATLSINWTNGVIKNTGSGTALVAPTNAEKRDAVEADHLIPWATGQGARFGSIPARPSVVAFTLWLTGRVDIGAAHQFHNDLNEMRTAGSGDARSTLLRRLQTIRHRNESTDQVQQAFYIIRAWNAWRKGEALHNLKLANAHGPFAFTEPI